MLIRNADAATRSMKDGDRVRVFNDKGTFKATATEDVSGGLLAALEDGAVNAISSAIFVSMGHGATFSNNFAQIESSALLTTFK